MPRGKPTPNCAECGQPRPLKHIGPPSSRGAAPLDTDVIAELRVCLDTSSLVAMARETGVSTATIGRGLKGEKVSVRARNALLAHTRSKQS